MPKLRSFVIVTVLLVAALCFLIWALYALGWESAPRAIGAFAQATLPALDPTAALFAVQARGDEGGVLIGHDFDEAARTAAATRIDLASGAATAMQLHDPFDRNRFALFAETPPGAGVVATRFRGIRIPRPKLAIFGWDARPGSVIHDDALTGREWLVRVRDAQPLLTHTLINGRDFPRSRQGTLSVFLSPGGTLVVCVFRTPRATTVWLFHNDTAHSQEKP
jgi:hypothetical protein